jgi:hypothetical protein
VGCFNGGNVSLDSEKGGRFIDQPSDYHLLKNSSAAWRTNTHELSSCIVVHEQLILNFLGMVSANSELTPEETGFNLAEMCDDILSVTHISLCQVCLHS